MEVRTLFLIRKDLMMTTIKSISRYCSVKCFLEGIDVVITRGCCGWGR